MKAFLLAAGKGTRLRPLTDTVPKCLVSIDGMPLLGIWLELLARSGIQDVLINTHHLAEQVDSFVARYRGRKDIRIRTVHEPKLLGSGGTLWHNQNFVAGEKDFVIAYADNLTNLDLTRMVAFHRKHSETACCMTMGLMEAPDPRACGIATLDDGNKIVTFEEKPENPAGNLANAGIYVASAEIWEHLREVRLEMAADVLDIGFHLLPRLAGKMLGYPITGYILDIGTHEALEKARNEWPYEKEKK